MVAAATRINLAKKKVAHKQRAKKDEWQDEAWEYFDEVPEIKYSLWFSGNAMAKLRLFAAVQPADPEAEPIPVSDPASGIPPALALRAEAEIARLKGPLGGQPEILRALNMNLDVAAECYLVGIGPREVVEKDPVTDEEITYIVPEAWSIRSIDEVAEQGGVYKIKRDDGSGGDELDPELDFIVRIWQRHPRKQDLPDCNMRAVLSDCEALVLLTNQVKAEAKSRQSAGAFTVPSELSFGSESDEPEGEGEETPDPFDEELLNALTEPIEDPSSASAVMPMVIRGPAEFLKADVLRHISFARDMTGVLEERIKARIERVARGLNLPVEVVMGHQQTTFANAEQIDKDTYEDHFEPRATLMCDGITVGFLRPQLHDAVDLVGYADLVDTIFVWADPSRLIGSPDPSDSADVGHDKLLISDAAWRRTKGWSDDDAPDALELLTRAGLQRGLLSPDLTKALLEMLGIPIDVVPLPQPPGFGGVPSAARMDSRAGLLLLLMEAFGGQTPEHVTPGAKAITAGARRPVGERLAAIDRSLRTRLLVAADKALERALERAGNRLKSKAGATRTQLKAVLPVYAAATLGPSLVAAAGFTDAELIGDEAWDALERQFMEWGANAQDQALAVAAKFTGFTEKKRDALKLRQAEDLTEAWSWMKESLTTLAHRTLYHPDPHAVALGEFDPTSRVPTGLVRQAVARIGGVNAIEPVGDQDAWVAVKNGGQPLGGVGTGDLLTDAMKDEGAGVEAYEWDYGSAYRHTPFQEHLDLAGQIFTDFTDPSLSSANSDWIPGTEYFPGDHAGCACDLIPILVAPEDFGQTTQGPND